MAKDNKQELTRGEYSVMISHESLRETLDQRDKKAVEERKAWQEGHKHWTNQQQKIY